MVVLSDSLSLESKTAFIAHDRYALDDSLERWFGGEVVGEGEVGV